MATAPNTPTNYYLDTPAVKRACADDFSKIDKACKPESQQSNRNRNPSLKKLLGAKRAEALDRVMSRAKDKFSPSGSNAWMEHCDGLWIKPSSADVVTDFNQQIQDLANDLSSGVDNMLKPLIDQVSQEIKDAALEAAKDKAIKAGARSAGRWGVGAAGAAVGGVGAVVTEAVATAWNLVDWVGTAWGMGKLGWESRAAIKEMRSILEIAQKAQQELDALAKNAASMSPTDLMGNAMGTLSRLNPCTRARRCLMVPYGKTDTASSMMGGGCCPGQTGHHVIPEEAVGSCDNYSHSGAPTVCVEGTNNANGTHGKIHGDLEDRVNKHKDSFFGGDIISYGKMRDIGIKSVQRTFPESKCDEKCLRAQLDAYYADKCKKPMTAAAGAPARGKSPNAGTRR